MDRLKVSFIALASLVLLWSAGCDSGADSSEGAEATSQSAESSGTTSEGPSELVFAFQPQENPQSLAPDADRMAKYMTDKLGVQSKVFLPTSYSAVVEALIADNADVAYFSGWPYLIARRKADVELLVAEERDGEPHYQSRWYTKADSGIESVADLKGKTVAFTSPTSTCGYLFPLARLVEEGAMEKGADPKKFFGEIVYAGGYQQALEALVHGRVDAAAGADYAMKMYLSEQEQKKTRVLSEQGPVPTHGVAVRSSLPKELKGAIKQAFLDLNDSENADLLKSLYGAQKLVPRAHEEHVGALKEALERVGRQHEDLEGFGAGSGSGHHAEAGSGEGSGESHGAGADHGSGEGASHGSGEGDEAGDGPGSGAGSARGTAE